MQPLYLQWRLRSKEPKVYISISKGAALMLGNLSPAPRQICTTFCSPYQSRNGSPNPLNLSPYVEFKKVKKFTLVCNKELHFKANCLFISCIALTLVCKGFGFENLFLHNATMYTSCIEKLQEISFHIMYRYVGTLIVFYLCENIVQIYFCMVIKT